jgi:hypothetical protein
MSTPQPADNYSRGIQTVERAIIGGVWKMGRHLTTADFTSHHGPVMPGMSELQVRLGRRVVFGMFTRKEIEDATDRVHRPATLKTIERLIAEAGQLRR